MMRFLLLLSQLFVVVSPAACSSCYWRGNALVHFPELPMNPKFALLLTLNDDSPFDTPGAALLVSC
jgi:hypothetical protein